MTRRPPQTEEEKARSRRSYAIALGCLAFVVLVFVITVLRISGNVGDRF